MILDDAVDETQLERLLGQDRIADRFISSALFCPTSRGSRWVPPKPGMIPSLISGWPNSAERAAMRMSHAIASSQPPPKARPLTAAIVATPEVPISRSSAWVRSNSSRRAAESASIVVNALMSAPALNRNGLEEAITSARTPVSRTRAQTLCRSSTTCGEIEFICPFASHAIATPPCSSSPKPARGGVAGECLQRDDLRRLIGVGTGVGVEALATLLPQPALGDEAAQDRRRGEPLAVTLRAFSIRSKTVSKPSLSARMNGGISPRRGSRPAPAIIPKSMSRWVATPSSSTRQASMNVFSDSISTSCSTSGSASPGTLGSPWGS